MKFYLKRNAKSPKLLRFSCFLMVFAFMAVVCNQSWAGPPTCATIVPNQGQTITYWLTLWKENQSNTDVGIHYWDGCTWGRVGEMVNWNSAKVHIDDFEVIYPHDNIGDFTKFDWNWTGETAGCSSVWDAGLGRFIVDLHHSEMVFYFTAISPTELLITWNHSWFLVGYESRVTVGFKGTSLCP